MEFTEEWLQDLPYSVSGEGDWADSVPQSRENPPRDCDDTRLIDIPKCNFNLHGGFNDALESLNDAITSTRGAVKIDRGFNPNDWDPSNTCAGGIHWNIKGSGGDKSATGLIATIRCCPCCNDDYGTPIFSWNCHLNLKF